MLIRNLNNQMGMQREWKWQISKEVVRLREAYMQAIDELRESAPKVLKQYAELGKDEAIQRALTDLSSSSRTKQKLGPSRDFQTAAQWLERTESLFQSDTIELHREGGIDHIDAMLDGKGPVRMVFDTGAGPTMIPAGLASGLGLKPTGRTVSCAVADGSKVLARIMIIPTIRVGKLTIKNVVCAVLPEAKGDVPPLLGQSFLRHFDYKYAQGSGRLVLTKVEPDQPASRSGPPAAGTRGQTDRPPPPRGKGQGS
jgi:predicted aspartyl protease